MKQVAVAIENPNNLTELNIYLAGGYDIRGSYVVKNTTLFVLTKYEREVDTIPTIGYAQTAQINGEL